MRCRLYALALVLACAPVRAQGPGPLRFRIQISQTAAAAPVSGRLLVFMTNSRADMQTIGFGFGGMFAGATAYVAAREVTHLAPGGTVDVDPDTLAYPRPFSAAPKDTYQVMALLDGDHSYARSEEGPGDITSEVMELPNLDPSRGGTVSLTLSRVNPPMRRPSVQGVNEVKFISPVLSRFWGRPITMRAAVVLPAGQPAGKRFPTVYHVPGFGGTDAEAWLAAPGLRRRMADGTLPAMAHVFLDPETPLGHCEYADSVNNGPWGTALTREFIPSLERRYPLVSRPAGRFLTGHSSGGWSTLWLQIAYPDFFNGTWSTGPDPVDFRSMCGADIAADAPANIYRTEDGKARNLIRVGGNDVMSLRDFARYELVTGEYGGQMASFDAVFSPRGPDGRPMRLFDRETGAVDPAVARAWRKYDIHRVLQAGGKPLLNRLRGKVHIVVGDQDNFHLNEAVVLLKAYLASVHSDARVDIVPGRDHMNLYSGGLGERMLKEMGARWAATGKSRR